MRGSIITTEVTSRSVDTCDAYLTQVDFHLPTQEEIEEREKKGECYTYASAGDYYISIDGNDVKLEDGMILEDFAGNIYTIQLSGVELLIDIDSSSSTWRPVNLSQLDLV